jgi:two-component system invasion response regulator UvrY
LIVYLFTGAALIKVLVADDHHLVRTSIVRTIELESGLKVIAEASDGETAIKLSREHTPDIVLMDIRMPGVDGLEATRKIVRSLPDVRVIVLTAYLEESYAKRLLEAGAFGFISKDTPFDEMIRAIRQVAHGERYLSPEIAQGLVFSGMNAKLSNPFEQLSSREMQVAMMIVNCHRVSEISDRLHLSPKTVNTYRYRIFEKLGVSTDVEMTHLALRHQLLDDFALDGRPASDRPH